MNELTAVETSGSVPLDIATLDFEANMPAKSAWGSRDFCVPPKRNVAHADDSAFAPLTPADVREAFAVPATVPPILSLDEAAELVKLRPQTLKRKVSEGLYAKSVVREKPLRFWRDRLVMEVMR